LVETVLYLYTNLAEIFPKLPFWIDCNYFRVSRREKNAARGNMNVQVISM